MGVLVGTGVGVSIGARGTVGTGMGVLVGAGAVEGVDASDKAFATRASTVASISGWGGVVPPSPQETSNNRVSRLKAMATLRFISGLPAGTSVIPPTRESEKGG